MRVRSFTETIHWQRLSQLQRCDFRSAHGAAACPFGTQPPFGPPLIAAVSAGSPNHFAPATDCAAVGRGRDSLRHAIPSRKYDCFPDCENNAAMHFDRQLLQRCWFLAGPTACGKSAAGCELAELLDAEIIALDSMSLYRGMDVGTAKPDLATRARVPHHLIDVLDPHE